MTPSSPSSPPRAAGTRVRAAPYAPLVRFAQAARHLAWAALPDGGQRVARRNAWAGMSADAARSRAQREADEALAAAARRARRRSG